MLSACVAQPLRPALGVLCFTAILLYAILNTTGKFDKQAHAVRPVLHRTSHLPMSGVVTDAALLRRAGDLNESQDYGLVLASSRSQGINFWSEY